MDGHEATRCLRLNPELARLPIVITSASASPEVDAASRAAGADDFIPKPIDRRILLQVLAKYLDLRWTIEARPAPSMPAPPEVPPAMAIPPRQSLC
jgi:CheY-like chemotaxis protein